MPLTMQRPSRSAISQAQKKGLYLNRVQTFFYLSICGWRLLAYHNFTGFGTGLDDIHTGRKAYGDTLGSIRSYTTLEVINYGIICAGDYQTFRSHIDSRAFATGYIVDGREVRRQIGRLRLTGAIYGGDKIATIDDACFGDIEGRCRCVTTSVLTRPTPFS